MAALNWALATRSACLTEGVKYLASLRSAIFDRQDCRGLCDFYKEPSIERPFASCGAALRLGQSAFGKGVHNFFHGFFTPPNALRMASVSSETWQMRLASRLASVVILRNGELALDGITMVKGAKPNYLDENQVRSMFNEIDTDGNGFIDRHELLPLLEALGLPANNTRYVKCAVRVLMHFRTRTHAHTRARTHVHQCICQIFFF
jgi:hypothetical protein